MKTYITSKDRAIKGRRWVLINAEGQVLGRLASRIATILRGKHKPDYTSHEDCGDFVIVTNAKKVKLTGQKITSKTYYKHTGYVGGLKVKSAAEMLSKKPEFVIKNAVKGMLPKTSLGRKQLKKLKVYETDEHPHSAQKPREVKW